MYFHGTIKKWQDFFSGYPYSQKNIETTCQGPAGVFIAAARGEMKWQDVGILFLGQFTYGPGNDSQKQDILIFEVAYS